MGSPEAPPHTHPKELRLYIPDFKLRGVSKLMLDLVAHCDSEGTLLSLLMTSTVLYLGQKMIKETKSGNMIELWPGKVSAKKKAN